MVWVGFKIFIYLFLWWNRRKMAKELISEAVSGRIIDQGIFLAGVAQEFG